MHDGTCLWGGGGGGGGGGIVTNNRSLPNYSFSHYHLYCPFGLQTIVHACKQHDMMEEECTFFIFLHDHANRNIWPIIAAKKCRTFGIDN